MLINYNLCCCQQQCCSLPPTDIFLTNVFYIESQYQFIQHVKGTLETTSCQGDISPSYSIYRYYTSTDITGGLGGQANRILLVVNCQYKDFCIGGVIYSGPAQMFFANSSWQPVTHIDNFPLIQMSGCVIIPGGNGGYFNWYPAQDNSHATCSSCQFGVTRVRLSPCDLSGLVYADISNNIPFDNGQTYLVNFFGQQTSKCYILQILSYAQSISFIPTKIIESLTLTTGCDDEVCL